MPNDWYPVGWLVFLSKGAVTRIFDPTWNPSQQKVRLEDMRGSTQTSKKSRSACRQALQQRNQDPPRVLRDDASMAFTLTSRTHLLREIENLDIYILRADEDIESLEKIAANEKQSRKVREIADDEIVEKQKKRILLMRERDIKLHEYEFPDDKDVRVVGK